MQLSNRAEEFTAQGFELVTMTYDSNEDALLFHQQSNLNFPILQDADSVHIKSLGILNETVAKDHWAYGVPYPGIYLVDASGIIRGKFAEQGYIKRPLVDDILEAVNQLVTASH